MFSKASSALAAFVFLQQLSSSSAQSSSSTYSADLSTSTACPGPGGAHIIIARGSLETPPYGVQVASKDKILAQIPGSTADGTIGYPNTLDNYQESETDGAIVARGLITDFVSRCPNSPLVLSGYSQGANILGDALIGQDDKGFSDNSTIDQPLPDSVLSQVAALVLIGDPTYVTTESFNVGNATMNGDFPRQNAALFDSTGLSAKARAYCNANDLFCAGGNSLAVHVSYFPGISDNLVAFAVSQVSAWYSANPSATGVASTGAASATKKPASASASIAASASASASKVSACRSKASGTAASTGTASMSRATSSATPSSTSTTTTTSTSSSTSSNGASSIGMSVAGAAAVVVGLFAAML